jgi:hypothetical protein
VKQPYSITTARPQDLARLPAIELAAARLLVGHAPESVLNETTDWGTLQKAQQQGRLWVSHAPGRHAFRLGRRAA